jgi:catechol 2,3-dioxygenase-like lactoylglutathione lyase family enzyme
MTATSDFPFVRAMPVLDCSDIAAALDFWRDKLGFDGVTWGEPPTFVIVQRGTVSVGLARRPKEEIAVSRNMAAYLYVKDVDALFAEYQAQGVSLPYPPETQPYNCREFIVIVPDGHVIYFGQTLTTDPLGPGLGRSVGRDRKAVSP